MLRFIIRHLQTLTILALALTGALAFLYSSPVTAVSAGIVLIILHLYLAQHFAYMNAKKFSADEKRTYLEVSPKTADLKYVSAHVELGDMLELRITGADKKHDATIVSLMHGHFRPVALLAVANEAELIKALKTGSFAGEVISLPNEENKRVFSVRIQAVSPEDDALLRTSSAP